MEMYHIEYEKPKVTLLQQSGLGVAEIAARTCYDSFENSENACVKNTYKFISQLNPSLILKLTDSLKNVNFILIFCPRI